MYSLNSVSACHFDPYGIIFSKTRNSIEPRKHPDYISFESMDCRHKSLNDIDTNSICYKSLRNFGQLQCNWQFYYIRAHRTQRCYPKPIIKGRIDVSNHKY